MVPQIELEAFRGLSLILQHRALVAELDAIARTLDACRSERLLPEEATAHLLPSVRRFALALPEHFSAESRSTTSLLLDTADAEFERQLRVLDGEHPELKRRFDDVVERLSALGDGPSLARSFEEIVRDLVRAIEAFRRHEAAEDALFAT